jgi:VCBS repeat protein
MSPNAARALHPLGPCLLALLACACGGADSGPAAPAAQVILARDRAADHGQRGEWVRAAEVLAPVVAAKGAAGEDLLRAACAVLANESENERVAHALPLLERAEKAGADAEVLAWCRYRLAAVEYDNEKAVPLLRALLATRPQDFLVKLTLAATLDDLDQPELEVEAQRLFGALLELPGETTVAWRSTMLFRLASSLQRQGKSDEAKPFFAEFNELDERGVKNPGTPAHQPGTLGEIRPHTQGLFVPDAPVAPAGSFEARVLAGPGARGVHVVQTTYAGSKDVSTSLGAAPEELYGLAPAPARIVHGPAGIGLAPALGAERSLLAADVLALIPFDRKNVGASKGTDVKKKLGDQDLDSLYVVAAGSGVELRMLENVDDRWSDGTAALASLPPLAGPGSLLDVDYDHDGDVDLLVTTLDGPRVLRNDGLDGTGAFADASAEAGLPAGSFRALSEDLDRDNDVDLLLVERASGAVRFLSNERGGRFTEKPAGLPAGLRGDWIVAADFDGDAWVDLAAFGSELVLQLRTPTGGWRAEPRRFALADAPTGEPRALDLDLDGTNDLVWPCAAAPAAGVLAPGFANGGLAVRLGAAFDAPRAGSAELAVADLDGDRDQDLLRLDETGLVAHLAAGAGRGLALALQGHKDFARGLGAVVEARSGLLYRRFYHRGAPELFGFGGRPIDALRVSWPNGVVQTNFGLAPGSAVLVAQRLGQLGSCPFLYTWNGTTYEFVSDVLGITPLGLPMAPGMLVPPDHDEYVLVKGEQLVPKDGFLEMHFTEELREVTYLDRIRLDVVDHPLGTEVFPNERFSFPPFPEAHTHTVHDPLVPLSAVDQDGKDWKQELARDDRGFAIPFEALNGPYRGLATPYTLELAFDPEKVRTASKLRLFLNGWFYWTDASVNMAVARHPDLEFVPPILSVPDGNGGWKELGPIGFPAGKLKTMAVDVSELLNRADPRIRLFSTLRLYWDSIRLATDADDAPLVTTALEPASASLWQRGFSRSFPLLGAHDCEWFEWDALEPEPRWNQHPGLYTRLGDTLPLVGAIDDRFVVMGAGDALTVRFDAKQLPPLPDGWRRDYLVFLDGWAKDRDPNTLEALYVEPLPFHGMSGFPYGPDERYPDDEAHRAYRREWNTRPARRWIEPLSSPGVLSGRASATSPMPASKSTPAQSTESVKRSPSTSTPAAPATSG